MWTADELRQVNIRLGENGNLQGNVHLETSDGQRGFEGTIEGQIEMIDGTLGRFDLVAQGQYWGEGQWTGSAPSGKFPFAVAIRLGTGMDTAEQVLPQALKGWRWDYLNP